MENELSRVVDALPGQFWTARPGGEIDFLNQSWCEFTGMTVAEARGQGWLDTIHPDDRPSLLALWQAILGSGEPGGGEARLRRFDGAYRWFQFSVRPLRDASGQIISWFGINTDVDDRKRAEGELRDSERKLSLIVNTIPTMAWSSRPDGTAEFFNQHYLDYVGLSADQAEYWDFTVAIHADDVAGLIKEWWQPIIAAGEAGETEARIRRFDGTYRWFLFRASPLRDETGTIVKWYGVNIDIEDRKRAETELRRSHDSFAAAQQLSKTGNFTADVVADEHVWSDELYRIFGFILGSKISVQDVRAVLHPEDLPAFDAGFGRSAAEGTDFDQTFRIITRDGIVKYLHAAARVIELVENRPVFIGAIQDVTESRLAEEALNKTRLELAHVARVTALSTLSASIAHEINQPLAGIVTNAGTCLRMLAAEPPNINGALETARRTIRDGNRASEVITRLRALFSNKSTASESVDLNEAARDIIALSMGELHRNKVELLFEPSEDLSPVTGDRVQLQQVILNLVRNASDAMSGVTDRPRQLSIRTEDEESDAARVIVRDAGVGFDPQAAEKIFDAFYTTKSDGMGIGLSVSRSIIESHGGRLWAEPNEGPGVTFFFSIPRRPKDSAANNHEPARNGFAEMRNA